jgi:hypothetical protein
MGRNGSSVYDQITGGWKRTVISMNGHDSPGFILPGEFVDEHDVEIGDDLALVESDTKDGVLEVHTK